MNPSMYYVGVVDLKDMVVVLDSATLITEKEPGVWEGKTVHHACIPIPESLAGCPDQALVFITPAGLLAWMNDGKLVTRFDHVNDK